MGVREFDEWCRFFRKYCRTGFNPFVREDYAIARLLKPHYVRETKLSELMPEYGDGEEPSAEQLSACIMSQMQALAMSGGIVHKEPKFIRLE